MDLKVELHPINELTEAERNGIHVVTGLAFSGDEEGQKYNWASGQWQVFGCIDSMVVASLEIVERLAKVGDLPVHLGGIGGVATHPDWRRRGFASILMHKAAIFLRNEIKVDFGLLVCGSERVHFYVGLGWQQVKGPLWIEQPSGKMVLEAVTMVLPCAQQTWPEGVIDLCGLPW